MVLDKSAKPQTDRLLPEHAHEERDVDYRVIVVVLVVAVLSAFLIHGALWWWLTKTWGPTQGNGITNWVVLSPNAPAAARNFPVLELEPRVGWKDYMERKYAALDSYAWADTNRRWVRIPIERAMQLIAEQGKLPQWNIKSDEGNKSKYAPGKTRTTPPQ